MDNVIPFPVQTKDILDQELRVEVTKCSLKQFDDGLMHDLQYVIYDDADEVICEGSTTLEYMIIDAHKKLIEKLRRIVDEGSLQWFEDISLIEDPEEDN